MVRKLGELPKGVTLEFRIPSAQSIRGIDRPPSRERAEPPEESLGPWIEQFITPCNGLPQSLMTCRASARDSFEHIEALTQSPHECFRGK